MIARQLGQAAFAAVTMIVGASWVSAAAAQEQLRPPVAIPPVTAPPVLKEDRLATSPPPRPGEITNPRWLRQARAEYPERAMARGIDGHVRLDCVAGVNMRLTQCRILEESPIGSGFGMAALAGAEEHARVAPRTVNGVAEPARVTFNVDFRLEGPPEPEPTPQP